MARDAAQAGLEHGAREAEHARGGFQKGVIRGMVGMALAGLTHGRLSMHGEIPAPWLQMRRTEKNEKRS